MASFDPLSDPLSTLSLGTTEDDKLTTIKAAQPGASWTRHDLFSEPFSSDSAAWAAQLDTTYPNMEPGEGSRDGNSQQEDEDHDISQDAGHEEGEETFTYPSSEVARQPISMASRPGSLSRQRTSSTSALRGSSSPPSRYSAGTSVTPRASSAFDRQFDNQDMSTTPSASTSMFPRFSPESTTSLSDTTREMDIVALNGLISKACAGGDLKKCRMLIEAGGAGYPSAFDLANSATPHTAQTPLHVAAGHGKLEIVRYLVEEVGAVIELEDGEGETPLHRASYRGHLDVCKFLVEAGANVETGDKDGWTPLHNASSRGFLDLVRYFVEEAGVLIDKKSRHGYSALMNASSKGHLPVVQFLLTKHRADPLLRNEYQETAFDLAASVFEVLICSLLANAESALWSASPANATSPYNPLLLHSTVPVVLHENQRLARPSLKRISSLGTLAVGQSPRWSPKALSSNDNRTAFTMPSSLGVTEPMEAPNRSVFRSEVGLPIVGSEAELVLPKVTDLASPARSGTIKSKGTTADNKRPSSGGRRVSASSSLSAVLGSTAPLSPPLAGPSTPSNFSATSNQSEPAWFWLSDWSVDLTNQASSFIDGWSYASSFDAPEEEWTSDPSPELQRILQGSGGFGSLGGQKWVRRRRWIRIMRRRLDLPSWGFAGETIGETESAEVPSIPSGSSSDHADYLVRAQFFAGHHQSHPGTDGASSVRSGKTVMRVGGSDAAFDRVELRKAAARLARASDEIRAGILTDDDGERRRKGEDQLESFLHRLALVKLELGSDQDEENSDDEFVYSGRDADLEEDAPSTLASSRPGSIASGSERNDSSSPPRIPLSSSSSSPSRQPDLTPQLSGAPDFRVPTHEIPQLRHATTTSLPLVTTAAVWERDDSARECRRCRKSFSFFLRKHHCRRCGQIVCASCSSNSDRLTSAQVVKEPGAPSDEPWIQAYRTCDTCHLALALPVQTGRASVAAVTAFFPSSPSLGSASPLIGGSDAGQSDVSELSECPVCGTVLGSVGAKEEQENHVAACLDRGGGTIAGNGRYLVFKLPPGPLVSEECKVCFVEFEVGDSVGRLPCFCEFHQACIRAWMERGHGCPLHREL